MYANGKLRMTLWDNWMNNEVKLEFQFCKYGYINGNTVKYTMLFVFLVALYGS